jgi:TolB-like protein/DNA-binding winged helix-turn-helix (wHTH) protein/Flp pilus assembly protein TadD
MGVQPIPPAPLRFGLFELDPDAGELRKNGLKLRLPDQPLQVLMALLERPGALVTRDDLRTRLWPQGTYVEFDSGLNAAIARLRQALGDSAENPRFIQTVPRQGYRFIAPVTGRNSGPEPLPAGDPADAADKSLPPRPWFRRAPVAAGFVLAAVSVAAGLWAVRRMDTPAAPASAVRALAVLPLEDISADAREEYFAEGLTEALVTELGKVRSLRVVSRQSAMRFKGTLKPVAEIADALRVDGLVQGSVLRSGQRVRVTVQLVRARPEQQLWAEAYERDLTDILSLQRDVARAIALQVRVTLSASEGARLGSARPVVPAAYEAYLKGVYYGRRGTGADWQKATEYFERSVALDPAYVEAHARLAAMYLGLGNTNVRPPHEVLPLAKATASRAAALDADVAEVQHALGWVKMCYDRDWLGAGEAFRRALEINPSNAEAHYSYGYWLAAMGRTDEAMQAALQARDLDPFSLQQNVFAGWMLYVARRYDDAIEAFERVLELEPGHGPAHNYLGWVYLQKGMPDRAISEIEQGAGERPSASVAYAYARTGRTAEARAILAELVALSKRRHVPPANVARVYAALDDRDQAFAWLERGRESYDSWMFRLADPVWDPLRDDPRFASLLRRLGLPASATNSVPSAGERR